MGSPTEVMGHGGHGEMSMAEMVRDMRNRFLVAVAFGAVITLWSRDRAGRLRFHRLGAVRAARRRVPAGPEPAGDLLLGGCSSPARFGPCARTLDMMVLVAVAVGAGWVYSVG
jgi:Cu2+-exporting ATPase